MARLNTGTTYRVAIDTEHTFIYIDASDKKDLIRFLAENYARDHRICGVKRLGWDGMLYPESGIIEPLKELLSNPAQLTPIGKGTGKKIHLLCEEYEDEDAIRSFSILAASEDITGLKELMKSKIKEDEYGYIKSKGVFDQGDTYFTTNFEAGFVEYYILEQEVKTKEQILNQIKTKKSQSNIKPGVGEKLPLDQQMRLAADSIQNQTSYPTNSNLER